MNIDLFTSAYHECGLLCNGAFDNVPAGIIFDAETADITIELMEDTPFHMNIPVQEELTESLLMSKVVHIGIFIDNEIQDTVSVPILLLNDPYGGEFGNLNTVAKPVRSILSFEQFMKRCAYAQALHRDNLGDEGDSTSILRDNDPKNLKFAANLTRQRQMELNGPQLGPNLGPSLGPNLSPSAPGLGSAPLMGGFTPKGPGGTRSTGADPRLNADMRRIIRKKKDDE